MNNNEMICIVCPMGCHITYAKNDADYDIQGNKCPRGRDYVIDELTNPLRTVTSSVQVRGSSYARLPVKTEKPIPKSKIFELMTVIKALEVAAPVKRGQVIFKNVLNTNVDLVSTRTIK